MATTRIMSMHQNKGKSIADCLSDRLKYATNGEKTKDGELVTAYACTPYHPDQQFMQSKKIYRDKTGRKQKNDVIAYQVRQSFHPNEKLTPEQVNQIGCEFAERFLKGNHAYIVATHVDTKCYHNHIIWNSTSLNCDKKFRDFLGSGKAVARLSDLICLEHGLSIIENPKKKGKHYGKWAKDNGTKSLTQSDIIRKDIAEILDSKPKDFEELALQLKHRGYTVKRGKHIAVKSKNMKRFSRLRSLGSEFTEENLKAVISGDRQFSMSNNVEPVKNDESEEPDGLNLLIDLDKALEEKGKGYQIWAKRFNTKQMAATINFLTEHKLTDYDDLRRKVEGISGELQEKMTKIKETESRLAEIKEIQTHIVNYSKTKDVYKAYHKSGYSPKFKEENITEILLHQSAKEFFNQKNFQPRPQMADLKKEFATLTAEKRKTYGEYNELKKVNKDILNAKANIEVILDIDKEQKRKEQEKNDKNKGNSL